MRLFVIFEIRMNEVEGRSCIAPDQGFKCLLIAFRYLLDQVTIGISRGLCLTIFPYVHTLPSYFLDCSCADHSSSPAPLYKKTQCACNMFDPAFMVAEEDQESIKKW